MNELTIARLDGKSYEEIQEDIINIINYYINLWYDRYPALKLHCIDKDAVLSDVFRGLCLRTKDDGLSNLERHFLKAVNNNLTMRYMANLLKKSTLMSLMCLSRESSKKPINDSLDRVINDSDDKSIYLSDVVQDTTESFERVVELKIALESIKHKNYPNYYYKDPFGSKIKLSSSHILNWIISGYQVSEMISMVYSYKENKHIGSQSMRDIRKDTIELAKEYLREYLY